MGAQERRSLAVSTIFGEGLMRARLVYLLVAVAVASLLLPAVANAHYPTRVCVSSATAELIEGRLVETYNGIDLLRSMTFAAL